MPTRDDDSSVSYAPQTCWIRFFTSLSESGNDLDWGDQWTTAFIEPLRAADARTILDLGCGSGIEVLCSSREGFEVTGLDYSREAVTQAQSKVGPNANFVVADMAEELPFSDACFDAVMSNVAAHMVPDSITRSIFSEVRRILRLDGLFMFHLNSLEDRPLRAKHKPQIREIEENYILEEDGQTMRFFSKEYLLELLSGWQTVDLEPVEIRDDKSGDPFKPVWRGIAHR